jgi:hypothetical protein
MEINEENFSQYFHDVRTHRPQTGEVMAKYTAVAYFEDGPEKWNVIDLLGKAGKAHAATAVMRKCFFASERDSVAVPRQMAEDLLTMTKYDVAKKSYKYTFEMFFYALPEHVPNDDPHWTTISLIDFSKKSAGSDKETQDS